MDRLQQKKFIKLWSEGNYRLGSTAQRLVPRLLEVIPPDATINDYGCGTGRAEVEIHAARSNQSVTMLDIAANSIEMPAQLIIKNNPHITFKVMDLSEIKGLRRADWGICINVLMTVQPDKLDDILKGIKATCNNVFFEMYDFDDEIRCGIQGTTVKKNRLEWERKLGEYWKNVRYEPSAESRQRYIFVCDNKEKEMEKVKVSGPIQLLKNRYVGQVCYIVGRGASLLDIKKEHFADGVVIALNESIQNIYALHLDNDIYNQWRNGDVLPDVTNYLRDGNGLILCDNPVLSDPPSSTKCKDYSPRYTFDCKRDLEKPAPEMFSHRAALSIGYQIFGCREFVMMGFDSFRNDDRTILGNKFVQSEYRKGDYKEQIEVMNRLIRVQRDISVEWFFPTEYAPQNVEGKKETPNKLNIGCGDVPIKGYCNIDLNVPADMKMDALHLTFPDNSVSEIYSSHLLEHFPMNDVPKALKEWHRVLRDGGDLKMNLPNLEWCMRNWLDLPEEKKWGFPIKTIFGLQSNDGEYHKTGFTKPRLTKLLTEAGFKNIDIKDIMSHQQGCYEVSCKKKVLVTAITLTGDREEAFALCHRWMKAQTRPVDQWIVVDDGHTPMKYVPKECEYIRREPQKTDPKHTLVLNMIEALRAVKGDYILVMEDDEYYGANFVRKMCDKLNDHEVVGIGRSKYYHLNGGWLKDVNFDHCSLAQTGFRTSFLPEFKTTLNGDSYLDLRLWAILNKARISMTPYDRSASFRITTDGRGIIFDDADECLYVGIKNMVGRRGIGNGHNFNTYYTKDPNYAKLKEWLGKEFKHYEPYCGVNK